jgi:translation elongation factor EF-Ts
LRAFYKQQVLLEQNLAFDDTVSIKSLVGTGEIVEYAGFLVGAVE